MATFAGPSIRQAEKIRLRLGFDIYLLVAAALLIVVGLMSIYSVEVERASMKVFYQQVVYTAIGIVPFAIFAIVKPSVWQRHANVLYLINVIALAAVLLRGHGAKGAVRWIEIGHVQFQPSEMAKIFMVITLATFFSRRQETIEKTETCLLSICHVAVLAGLVILQPHLGATTVLVVAWAAITIVAQVPWHQVGTALLIAVLCLVGLLAVPSARDRLIPPYWQQRWNGLVNNKPAALDKVATAKAKKNSYQTDQAKMAFSSGGVSGTGYLKGEMKRGGFIPEQHNDFIFTVPGEEAGFVGCTLILVAYGFFFYRVWLILLRARDPYHRMLVAGIYAVLGFHMFANLAMVLNLIPVVGLWLPFMSYGGTAMWLCLACVGLLVNIDRRERAASY